MVNGIEGGGSFARDAIKAAIERQAEAQRRMESATERLQQDSPRVAESGDFKATLAEGLRAVDGQVKLGDELVEGLVTGKIAEFHEVAAQVKQADLSFKFALSVRNKFIDAYREVMRMSV
jgi:flagellar hook-basal body complex protein FliE